MKKIIMLLFAAAIAGGCSLNPFHIAQTNVENSKKLRVGMTKSEVLAIMGEPVKDETFNRPDIWFYYFNMNWFDGFTTEDECFPVIFKDGKVAGWGHVYYTKARIEDREKIAVVEIPEKK